MAEKRYALTCLEDVKEGRNHFRLDRGEISNPKITYFDIMSTWYPTALKSPDFTLVVVKAEEFESVKNFLLTLRG
jgi:hypothetical protein